MSDGADSGDIEPGLFLGPIHTLLRDVGLPDCEVLIEESVQAWAAARGHHVQNPLLAAMAVNVHGVPTIIVRRRITPDMQTSITNRIELGGFEVDQLQNPSNFLEHLVLHEAAHLLLHDPSEEDCDHWAFEHLAGRLG